MKKFWFYENFKDIADNLSDDMRLKFYDALMAYVFDGVEPEEQIISALIIAVKPNITDEENTWGGARKGAGRKSSFNQDEIKFNQDELEKLEKNQDNLKNLENEKEKNPLNNPQENKNIINIPHTSKDVLPLKEKKFIKPTFEEVQAYCHERKNNVDVARWFDYYTANGWKVGKNAMKDWRAAVRTWERGSVAATASRKTANDDAEYWEAMEKRLMENSYE